MSPRCCIRCSPAHRLCHQVCRGSQSSIFQRRLHSLHHRETDLRIKEAVDANQRCSSPCNSDSTLLHTCSTKFSTGSHAKHRANWEAGTKANLDSPFQLGDVAKELENDEVHPTGHQRGEVPLVDFLNLAFAIPPRLVQSCRCQPARHQASLSRPHLCCYGARCLVHLCACHCGSRRKAF